MHILTPVCDEIISKLKIGDMVTISGYIYCGRDAVLPKVVHLAEKGLLEQSCIDLSGGVVFHTAVSPAGVGPTSSNKLEIESSIEPLSKAGVKMHLGKGAISPKTVEGLRKHNAVFAVIPPVTALLEDKTLKKIVVAFPEEGMEALHMLKVDGFPAIIAAAHGETIYG